MRTNAPGPRPRQVTVGGWVIAVASAMLVVSVFDSMANLHSVDTRDSLMRTLTSGSARDLGVSLADALSIMRAALFVAGAAAAVTGVLGVFVLQRHTAARVVLTVAAVPVVLTAPFSGGVLALLIGVATAMLWSQPARDWFAGRPPAAPERSSQGIAPLRGPAPTRPAPWSPPSPPQAGTTAPPPTHGWGQPAGPESWPPPRVAVTPASDGPPTAVTPASDGPPTAVRVACVLTWIFSTITGVLYLLLGVALLVDRAGMLDLLRDNPTVRDSKLGEGELVALIVAVSAVVVLWCVGACVLAFLVWRRHGWAWLLLQVAIGTAFVVELLGFPFTLLHLIAAATALRLLLVAPVRAWFRNQDGPAGPRPPYQDWGPPTSSSSPPTDSGTPPVW